MKKILAYILTIILVLTCFTACNNGTSAEPKELSCEDIIKAYEDAGYYVEHGALNVEAEDPHLCYIKASKSKESNSDYIYFMTFLTDEQAKEASQNDKYNFAVWLFAAVMGESRWLKTGTYGKIEYSYYSSELIKPFNELIK